jgi:peptidyl-prolyl cis-trans isomerase C
MKQRTVISLLSLALLLGAGGAVHGAVVATIGSEKIDDVEFNAKVGAEERAANRKLSPEEKQAVLQALINQRLLVSEAKDEGLSKKDEVRRTVEDSERQILSNQVYEREVSSKVKVDEGEVKAFFEKNPQLFDLRQVSQILVQPLSKDKEMSAENEAKRLKAKVQANPKSFAELAKSESDDSGSKEKGGDLGFLRRGTLLKELEEAVFTAKPGSIVGPVRTQFGFHILYVRSAKKQSYEEAKELISREMARARTADLQQKSLEQLGKKYKVSINKDK